MTTYLCSTGEDDDLRANVAVRRMALVSGAAPFQASEVRKKGSASWRPDRTDALVYLLYLLSLVDLTKVNCVLSIVMTIGAATRRAQGVGVAVGLSGTLLTLPEAGFPCWITRSWAE